MYGVLLTKIYLGSQDHLTWNGNYINFLWHQVWGADSRKYYVNAMLIEKPLAKPYEDMEDDPLQLAGDIIFKNLSIFLSHVSATSADRVEIDHAIEKLKNSS